MRLVRTPHFLRAYNKAPQQIQHTFDSKRAYCLQASATLLFVPRSTTNHRTSGKPASPATGFYFTIEGRAYVLHEIKIHPK